MQTATINQVTSLQEAVMKVLNSDLIDALQYLKGRWSDEKEYEDFKDYEKRIKEDFQKINSKFEFKSLSKSFKVTIASKELDRELVIGVRIKSKNTCCLAVMANKRISDGYIFNMSK